MICFFTFPEERQKYHRSSREITRSKDCTFSQDLIKVKILPPDKVGIDLSHSLPGSEKNKNNNPVNPVKQVRVKL
jgi:hypothetical protein